MMVDTAPYAVNAGDLVYVDSFADLVPARLTGFRRDADGVYAVVKVTADRSAFRRGESLPVPLTRVIRRESVTVRGGKFVITNNWHVVADDERIDVSANVDYGS